MKPPIKRYFAFTAFILTVPIAATAQTMFQRELEQARQERQKAITSAMEPINRRYRDVMEQLLRRATQANDLDTALKIKDELANVALPATTKFSYVKAGSAAPTNKDDDPEDVFKGKTVRFNNHTGKDIIFSAASQKPISKVIYRGVAFFKFTIQIRDASGRQIAKTEEFNDGNKEKTIEVPLSPGLQSFTITIRNDKPIDWTQINEIKFE